jgi:tRNA nucleotidyltransferase (CCA-adding enzyme)
VIRAASSAAARARLPVYLVGGTVRDLLLGASVEDLDLVVEGDAGPLARALARRLKGQARFHSRFGTATVALPDGQRLDLATARAEEYDYPGALPRVRRASIREDLARRDFTVNAMAFALGERHPVLLDPFGGEADLARRLLRVLHPRSFLDDPTRAFRAVRYANRLAFRIEPETARLVQRAAAQGAFAAVSGDRLRREIALIFSEPRRAEAVRGMARLGLPALLHPSLRSDAAALARLRAAERLAGSRPEPTGWRLYLLTWIAGLPAKAVASLAARLSVAGQERRILLAWPRFLDRLRRLLAARDLSRVCAEAAGRSAEELLAAAACLSAGHRRALLAGWERSRIALSISGRDLVAAGVPAGPAIGRALSRTLAARREGAISARRELEFALAAARSDQTAARSFSSSLA